MPRESVSLLPEVGISILTKGEPMAHVLVRHKVANFARWKRAYDAHSAARRKAGLKEKSLLRSVRNPRDVFILFQAGNLKKAKGFVTSPDLRKAMKSAGVVGKPEFTILR
jgi:hypothetical protein